MQVICLEDEVFYALFEKVIAKVVESKKITEDCWISGEEAMKKLRITSKTTLQKLRDEGRYIWQLKLYFRKIACYFK